MAFLLTIIYIGVILTIIMAVFLSVYFLIYKRNINKVVMDKEKKRRRMIPPFKMAFILLIVLLLLIMAVIYLLCAELPPGSLGVTSLPLDAYLEEVDNPEIDEWLSDNVKDDEKAYVLQHHTDDYGDDAKTYFLVYIPCAANDAYISVNQSLSLFRETIILDYEAKEGDRGNLVALVTYTGGNPLKLKLSYGEHGIETVISETDYPIKLGGSSDHER